MSQEKERISWRFNTFHTPSTLFAKITIYGLVIDKRKKETLKATVNKKENSMLNLEEVYIIINVRRGGKFARKSRLKA